MAVCSAVGVLFSAGGGDERVFAILVFGDPVKGDRLRTGFEGRVVKEDPQYLKYPSRYNI